MPELKRNFTKGRMVRDLDDRLLPPGEYRDASNIQVTNSAGANDGDIGAIETVLGNNKQNFHSANGATIWADNFGLTSPTCIGAVKDNQNNKIYWFITSTTADCIMEYDEATSIIAPVIVDFDNVLNFNTSNLITGVNILEDMLFFTDNLNEPRVLNIDTFKTASATGAGKRLTPVVTLVSGTTDTYQLSATTVVYDTSATDLGETGTDRNRKFSAEDIEVIKQAPRNVLTVNVSVTTNAQANAAGNFNGLGPNPLTTAATDFDNKAAGGSKSNVAWTGAIAWTDATGANHPVVLTHTVQNEDLTEEIYEVRGYFSNFDSTEQGDLAITSVTANIAEDSLGAVAWQMLKVQDEPIFKNDFPRFAYRYKFLDGQYSPLSPFSDAAFIPGQFEYKGMKGENLGMDNQIRLIHLEGIRSFSSGNNGDSIPRDSETIEIIYKAANSTALYVVKEIKISDYATNPFLASNAVASGSQDQGIAIGDTLTEVVITSDALGRIIEDAQLLRLFDNVPKKALAQEIVGNRVVYGNYLQNYDVDSTNQQITAGVTSTAHSSVGLGLETVKSDRTYQLGIAYMDEKGRTSPVFSRPESSVKINFKEASKTNKITAVIDEVNVPSWAAYGKWYIKDNSTEYYNLALDRFYEAEDGSTWLAFPSSERNKVKEGDFLKLKKQHDSATAVTEDNKFKVIDISNEVPRSISNVKEVITSVEGAAIGTTAELPKGFNTGSNVVRFYGPLKDKDNADTMTTGGNEEFFKGIRQRSFIRFDQATGVEGSALYQIKSGGPTGEEHVISGRHYLVYELVLTEVIKDTDPFLKALGNEDPIKINLFRNVQIQLPEFAGRFYVRINPNGLFRTNVKDAYATTKSNYILDITAALGTSSATTDLSSVGSELALGFQDDKNIADGGSALTGLRPGDSNGKTFTLFIARSQTSGFINETKFRLFIDKIVAGAHIGFTYRVTGTPTTTDLYRIEKIDRVAEYNRAGGFGQGRVVTVTLDRNWDDDSLTNVPADPDHTEISQIHFYRERLDTNKVSLSSDNPAIFETEPIEVADVDLFYEASAPKNILKAGMLVTGTNIAANTTVSSFNLDASPPTITLNQAISGTVSAGATIVFAASDEAYRFQLTTHGSNITSGTVLSMATGQNVLGMTQTLSYHNAYSFGNGVESDRIRDDFNANRVGKGVKVSSTTQEPFREERRGSGLIYSGIYNSRVGFNESNQFSMADTITKDLNPVYGTIQKLSARGAASRGDLLVLCEDKCFRILANKDALFNADGNPQLTASTNVLGQIIPFAGEYGISTNPESFAYWGFRSYFADKSRGVILRLSGDGLTDISAKGMGNFFTTQLKNSTSILNASYDEDSSSYNIRIGDEQFAFSEASDGWTSKLTYVPEAGISLNNEYYTFKNGEMWKHNNTTRANFYGTQENSIISTTFNAQPDAIKNFKTLSYEGDTGWTATMATDQQEGQVTSFVEREGKYYNYINGTEKTWSNSSQSGTLDFKDFNVQGIGQPISVSDGGTTITFEFASLPDFAINKLSNTAIGSTTTLGSDIIFYVNATTGLIYKIGNIRDIPSTNNIRVHNITSAPAPTTDDLVFVSKDNVVNTSGIIGYFNRVTLTNTNADKNELFAIGTELFISS